MKIEELKLADIKPYERNQKKHPDEQINNIAISIDKYGFIQPIVVDGNNEIVIGHGRYLAAKKLEIKNVPCVRVEDLDEEEIRKLRIIDNKLNESEWDIEKLKEDIDELDFSEFDIDFNLSEDIAFDEEQLNNLFEDSEPKDKEPKKIQCPHCGEWFEA